MTVVATEHRALFKSEEDFPNFGKSIILSGPAGDLSLLA